LPERFIVWKVLWSSNGYRGFDNKIYENYFLSGKSDKMGYEYAERYGIGHEWWNFYEGFSEEYYFGYAPPLPKPMPTKFENGGLVIFISRNFEDGWYLVGVYGNCSISEDGFQLNRTLWDTIDERFKEKIKEETVEELKSNILYIRASKEYSTVLAKPIEIDLQRDLGVKAWRQMTFKYIDAKMAKRLLRKLISEIEKLGSHDEIWSSKRVCLEKLERVYGKYFGERAELKAILNSLKKRYSEEWREIWQESKPLIEELRRELLQDGELEKNRIFELIRKTHKELKRILEYIFAVDDRYADELLRDERFRANLREIAQIRDYDEAAKILRETINMAKGLKITSISTLASIIRTDMFLPVLERVLGKELRELLGVKRFWGDQSNLDQYLEFTKKMRKVANALGISNMLEVAYYLSKYRGGERKEKIDLPEFRLIDNLLYKKGQVILYGPPGTGKTWIAIKYAQSRVSGGNGRYEVVTFHPSFAYEDFVEGLKPKVEGEEGKIIFEVEGGVFKRLCIDAFNALIEEAEVNKIWLKDAGVPKLDEDERERVESILQGGSYPKFYLVIDEINRGDIAKIFGELITLLEKDKRLFAENEMRVKLPYSKTEFGVSPNLFIIGTMNTADRSIALIDVALRRRFSFIELMPDYKVLEEELLKDVADVKIREILKDAIEALRGLNIRIRAKYDRDHQIGHSYLLKLKGKTDVKELIEELKLIWFHEILPLLQEYFYDSPEKLREVLKGEFIKSSNDLSIEFIESETVSDEEFLGKLRRLKEEGRE